MKYIRGFLSFWYHFIVGDDWTIAAGVIIGLGLVGYVVHRAHIQVWWLLPILVMTMLTVSLWFETRRSK